MPGLALTEPTRSTTVAQPAAVIPIVIPRARIREVMGPALAELHATLADQGLTPQGPAFALHRRVDPAVFDLELGLPIAGPLAPSGRVRPGVLPAVEVVAATLTGTYEQFEAAWAELDAWILAARLRPAWPIWVRYLVGPREQPDPRRWQTELVHTVVPA